MMIRRRFVIFLACCLTPVGCVRPSTRRIHAENMAKAEDFEREFDHSVPLGHLVPRSMNT